MCLNAKIIAIVLLAVILTGRAVGAGETLTWDDCVVAASKQNSDIRSAKESFSSSEYKAKAAYSGFLPQVSGSAGYTNNNSSTSTSASYSAELSATQNIFAGFHDKALIDQSAANKDVSKAGLDSAKVQVSFDLKTAFASLLYAQDYSKLEDDIIKRREENSRLVELRFEGGMENRGSVLLSKAFLSQALYEKKQAGHLIEVTREQLARVMGIENAEKIKIAGKIPIAEPSKEPNLIDIARETPKYRQAVMKEKATKAGVTLARSKFSPALDVFATASRQGNNWFPESNRRAFGFNVSVPIFNGGNDYFLLQSSKSDLSAAREDRESVERTLLPDLKRTFTNFLDAYEKLKVDRDFLTAATVRADIARNKYNNGLLSFEDWDIIENDLISKQKNVIQSERDLYLAEAEWYKAQGKGVIK